MESDYRVLNELIEKLSDELSRECKRNEQNAGQINLDTFLRAYDPTLSIWKSIKSFKVPVTGSNLLFYF